jgi:DNA-directed RNA polymerase specialized sigma24 family protein
VDRYINDDELIYMARCGSQAAEEILYQRYYRLVKRWIKPFCYHRIESWDDEDYLQFAMMMFSTIMDSYRIDQKTSLKTFMKQSLIRRILSLIRVGKDEALATSQLPVSLDCFIGDDERMRFEEIVGDPLKRDYPDLVLRIKETETCYDSEVYKRTSLREREVMAYKKAGYDEKEIANRLDISIKSVYNAVYRYHQKMLAIDELK